MSTTFSDRLSALTTGARGYLPSNRRRDQIIGFGAVLLAWEAYGRTTSDLIMVPFSTVIVKAVELYATDVIYEALAQSLQQMLVGYAIAAGFALVIGVSMGRSSTVEYLLDTYTNVLFVTSYAAMLPLLIILFGISWQFRVAVVFLNSVFHMIFSFKAGVENIDEDLVETGRVFGATRYKLYRHVVLPASLPFIIAGLRLGLGRSWKGIIIAELWVIAGIGSLLDAYRKQLALGELFVVVLTIMVLGIGSVKLLYWLQRKIAPWEDTAVR